MVVQGSVQMSIESSRPPSRNHPQNFIQHVMTVATGKLLAHTTVRRGRRGGKVVEPRRTLGHITERKIHINAVNLIYIFTYHELTYSDASLAPLNGLLKAF